MEANRERTLVGLFVLIAGGLLFGTLLALSSGVGTPTVPHRTYFKFAGGVQPGAPVRFGGLAVGKVTRVRVDPANSTRIEIAVAVSKDAPLRTDSVAKVTTLGPLTDNYIEISTGSEGAAHAQPGSILQSTEAFGLPQLSDAAQTMVPEVKEALQKLNQNLEGMQATIARANDLLNDSNRKNIASSLSGIAQTVAEARPKVADSLDKLSGMLTDARPKVSASLTNVQQLTAKLEPVLDDLKTTTTRANETLAHVDAVLVENRPDIRASISGLRETVAKSSVLLDQFNQILSQNSDNIDGLLENMRMTAENLRVLTETVARSPASLIRGVKASDRQPGEIGK
ncbi:MAG: MlaD family protein [Bryobacteraceae bacterium]|jgi:phospholipid/cholesterol/gamma-HCH transport system substrate-binding protein